MRVDGATGASSCCGWRCRSPQIAPVDAVRAGDDLVLTVGGHRRVLTLPSALRRCEVAGGEFDGGELRVRFRPRPEGAA